ncbi:MAG TPA: type II secretion system protein [Desulfosporosinus sp.]|nr:type II secretion system protein [Desulfosporosinus sp.]
MGDKRSRERGFTLLEIMLVLILLSGAGFVLLIKLPIHLEKERLAFATTQLLEEIRDTRQAALAENNWYEILFYTSSEDHNYKIFRQGTRVKDINLSKGIKFVGQPNKVKFLANGRTAGTTIVLTNSSGEQKSVIIAPVGMRIREE